MDPVDNLFEGFLLEDLMLQRDFYLNTFKHLELKNIDDNSKETKQMVKTFTSTMLVQAAVATGGTI